MVDARENERLNEVRFALDFNNINKLNEYKFRKCIIILSCLSLTYSNGKHNNFYELIKTCSNTKLLGAGDKTIIGACNTFFSSKDSAKKLGMTPNYYCIKYRDLKSRDFITEEWLNSLESIFPSDKGMIKVLCSFIEKFYFPLGEKGKLEGELRTYELDFWVIYNKLMMLYESETFVNNFIIYITNILDIKYSTISYLINNLHKITRMFPHSLYGHRQFLQELCNLEYSRGISKGDIGKFIFNNERQYLYDKEDTIVRNVLNREEFYLCYKPTLDWDVLDKDSIIKFIDLFKEFIEYDIK